MTAQAGGTASSSLLRAKAQQRQQLRAIRRGLSPSARRIAALRAANALVRAMRRWNARHVAIYLGLKEELDTAPAIAALQMMGCEVYVPLVRRGHAMRFARLAPPFTRNRYGIAEPLVHARPPRLDCVVLPLVGFDAAGRRLGMGGGYYDRWLAKHPRLRRVGYAYAAQRAARIPVDARDIPLHYVVTENGILKCAG